MLKKIIAGTLILVVLSTSGMIVYAGQGDELGIDGKTKIEYEKSNKKGVKIIRPKIGPEDEVVADKNLLISIKVFEKDTVKLSVLYKKSEDIEDWEVLPSFDSEEIKPNPESESDFFKHIKNVKPGLYNMVIKKDGEKKPIEDIEFKVKKAEEVVNEEKKIVLPNLLDLSITDLLPSE